MNFGSNVQTNNPHNTQQPTYHLAPNFTTRPSPLGPLDLGTIVEDLQSFYPINQGAGTGTGTGATSSHVVPIPPGQRYTDTKEDVTSSIKASSSREAILLARILDGSIGGDASLKGQRSEENVYNIARLETSYFFPSPSYIKQCLKLDEVKDYLEMANYNAPVYLITGLKIAWGATVSTKRGREVSGTAGADFRVAAAPAAGVLPIDAQLGASVAVSRASGVESSFGKPADFVLGIQVLKVYHKRAFYVVGKPYAATQRVVKNAVLVDNEPVPEEEEEEDDDVDGEMFKIADVDESDVEGFVPMTTPGEELWFVPRDL